MGVLPKVALLGSASTPVLNQVNLSALVAFSLRLVNRSYIGPCCTIRRSSDNATSVIGFNGKGSFNIAAFLSFVGAGSGFITKWNDQGGNGNDVSQSTAANQPQLIASAFSNGNPGVLFGDNTAFTLATAAISTSIMGSGGFYSSAVNVNVTTTASDALFVHGTFSPGIQFGNNRHRATQNTGGSWNASGGVTGSHVLSGLYNSSSISNVPSFILDGTAQSIISSTQPTTIVAEGTNVLHISGNGASGGFPGHVGELVIASSQPNLSQMNSLIGNQRAYWGTS